MDWGGGAAGYSQGAELDGVFVAGEVWDDDLHVGRGLRGVDRREATSFPSTEDMASNASAFCPL